VFTFGKEGGRRLNEIRGLQSFFLKICRAKIFSKKAQRIKLAELLSD